MSEERLKEIHDSIEFQMQLQQAVGYKSRYDDLLVEEIDLYNEVIDLQEKNKQLKEVIEEVREYIEETIRYKSTLNEDNWEFRVKTMLQILDKAKDKETNKPIPIGQVVSLEEAEYYFIRDNEELCGD